MFQSEGPSTQSTTYEPEHYEEINVEWNDGKSFGKADPNKPNLLTRVTVPAATGKLGAGRGRELPFG